MSQLVVGIAECLVSKDPSAGIGTYGLGSCIAVTAYDPVAQVGGMLHYMLPEYSAEIARGQTNSLMFADTGIPWMVHRAEQLGAISDRLVFHAAGGAQVVAGGELFHIGKRNLLGLRQTLRKLGYTLKGSALGGNVTRSLFLDIGTGRVSVRQGACLPKELAR